MCYNTIKKDRDHSLGTPSAEGVQRLPPEPKPEEKGNIMKRVLTFSCEYEFDDNPFDEVSGQHEPVDVADFILDIIDGATSFADLIEAKLDGKPLLHRDGFISEEVKLSKRYKHSGFACIASAFGENAKIIADHPTANKKD